MSQLLVLSDDFAIKEISNVEGNCLMGHDFKPRHIDQIETERGYMFKITLTNVEKPLILGEKNMLTLKNKKTGDIMDIKLGDFYNSPMYFSNDYCFYGVDSKADMDKKPVPLDPYLLGLWLGKGVDDRSIIKTSEPEIGTWLIDHADKNAMEVSNKTYKKVISYYVLNKNQKDEDEIIFMRRLHDMGVVNNKHIPKSYLKNCKNVRLSLLAALIDVNGSKDVNIYYTIRVKEEKLKDDIIFLTRSLGFNTTCTKFKKNNSYTIRINGELISQIPCKMERKKTTNPKRTKSMEFGIKTITKIEDGIYNIISIHENDGRYLTGEFITMRYDKVSEPKMRPYVSDSNLEIEYEMPSAKRCPADYSPSSMIDFINPLSDCNPIC
jgi:replicative DNA helicase